MCIQIPYIYEFILVLILACLERQLSNVSCVVEEFMVGLDFMGLFLLHIYPITITDYYHKYDWVDNRANKDICSCTTY